MSTPKQPFPDREATWRAFGDRVNRGKVLTYEQFGMDLVMGARSGARFWDAYSDRGYFNCHCNGGVFNLGHRNAEVAAALRDALDTLDIGNHHLVSGIRARVAEQLSASTAGLLPCTVFGVSGGEANDLALKLARGHTERRKIVSAIGGYHGHTGLALATGDPAFRDPFGRNLDGFVQVPFNDLDALEVNVGDDTAAVILEPIPATLGMPLPSPGYLAGVQRLCRQHGALFILDEVQTGLGRTGTNWYFQQEDVQPDMVVTGKGLSGGIYPITATLMTSALHRFFDQHGFIHVSTYGGAELGCVVASKVLEITCNPDFLARVRALADRFRDGLAGLPFTLRQRGLFMGLKFGAEGAAMMASKMLYGSGLFALYAANDTSVLQFLPPLTLTDEEADAIIAIVRRTFSA